MLERLQLQKEFYSTPEKVHKIGETHDGESVMDWMDQERTWNYITQLLQQHSGKVID